MINIIIMPNPFLYEFEHETSLKRIHISARFAIKVKKNLGILSYLVHPLEINIHIEILKATRGKEKLYIDRNQPI